MTDENCIFCDIVGDRSPARFLYQDEEACAFLDAEPVRRGHSLVVPNEHVVDLTAERASMALMQMAKALPVTITLLRRRLGADGVSVFQSNGLAAGQTIEHIHFHLVPRFQGDARLTKNWLTSQDALAVIDETHALLTQGPAALASHGP